MEMTVGEVAEKTTGQVSTQADLPPLSGWNNALAGDEEVKRVPELALD